MSRGRSAAGLATVAVTAVLLASCGGGREALPPAAPPNVLLLVVDTLRADHLPTYGYPRDTAPAVDALLARRGVVFDAAVAQAPWTIPSVASYLTGVQPGELRHRGDGAFQAVPADLPTLAERLRDHGYRTAAFIANPTVHAGIGFARGFDRFYTPEVDVASLRLHGDDVQGRALAWLAEHADAGPWFLYVHFLDPHDPYENPDMPDARSPFLPEYDGPVDGDWPHALYSGRRDLAQADDPEAAVRQLTALYDGEIRYADRLIGELVEALPPEVTSETLMVFTSDHGEELHDHGWWKHGHTVYQEQLHVPLVVRWDGRLPAGRRVAAPVELVDLVPTLLAAAGVDAEVADGEVVPLDGVDLLPVLRGAAEAPRRPALADHLAQGPRRAAVRLGDLKLVLFDRHAPYEPEDPLAAALYETALRQLRRVELYDLSQDPRERRNLAAERPEQVWRLAPLLHRQLDCQQEPGVRVALGRVPAGAELRGRVVFQRPPAGVLPAFLAAADRVERDGRAVRFVLTGEAAHDGPPHKGFRVTGDVGAVAVLEVALDGQAVAPVRVRVGAGSWTGGAVEPARLTVDDWPLAAALRGGTPPLLAVWRREGGLEEPVAEGVDEETARRLRALGYIQ